jgi:uncharacterized membrane protein
MLRLIAKHELIHAQIILLLAISLQSVVWQMNDDILVGLQYVLIPTEIILAILISFTVSLRTLRKRGVNHVVALFLLGMITAANVASLIIVLHSLIISHTSITSIELLGSALAIFITNVIVFALWYWEIDSPGLSGHRWKKSDQDFQFTQQDMRERFASWRPEFLDYLYLSTTNAINFAAADARPLTHSAKLLMGVQALVSVFTLALVLARSVSILGT